MKKNKPKLSIVVPVYGVESFIERCARSLFEQTLTEIEYIFVDDCSKDESLNVLERIINDYPEKREQITILHHENNMGLPQARKTGVLFSSGDYIAHCDSDDWVDRNFYQSMYEAAVLENADMVISDFYRTDGANYKIKCQGTHTNDVNKLFYNFVYQKDPWSMWNKIVKRTCYEGIIYPLHSMGEDMAFTFQLLKRCNIIAHQHQSFYYYFYNCESISKSPSIDSVIKRFNGLVANVNVVKSVYPELSGRKGPICYLEMLAMSSLYYGIKDTRVCKLFTRTNYDIFQILSFRVKLNVKVSYLYCLFYSCINRIWSKHNFI